MHSNDKVVLQFEPNKTKFGYQQSLAPMQFPSDINTSSLLYKLAVTTKEKGMVRSSQAIRWLLKNPLAFPEFAQPLSSFTLEKVMLLRNKLFEASFNPEHFFPKTYASSICGVLNKIDVQLSCGRYIRQWGRFRLEKKEKTSRQIEDKDLIWEEIKTEKTVEKAKAKSKKHVDKQYNDYHKAAWEHIKAYQKLLKASENLIIETEIDHNSSKHRKVLKKLKELGYDQASMGSYQLFLTQEWRGVLSVRTLVCILVICKLNRPLNTDTWLTLRRDNFTFKKTSIEVSSAIKSKTNKHLSSFKVLNRERELFSALRLLNAHVEATKNLIDKLDLELIREPFIFDYLTSRGRSNNLGLNRDFQYLRGIGYKRFLKSNNLDYLSLETLRNLTATKRFLDGNDLRDIQKILGHSELSTTQHYISQHVTSSYLRHNILTFMRDFEVEAVNLFDTGADKSLHDINSTEETNKYFLIGDGASCADPKDSPDKRQEIGELCNGTSCHAGCKNKRIILTKESIWQALVKRESYRTSWFSTHYHEEKFGAFEVNKILFNALLCQFIAENKPQIYKSMMSQIKARINAKELL